MSTRPGVQPSDAVIANWWRQGMTGGAKAHYDGIVAFSQTDFTDDLSAKLLPNATLKTYAGFPHGMPTTQAATINADLLGFIRS